jgi:hypothetical protein
MEPAIETTQSPIVHVHKLFALNFHTKSDCFALYFKKNMIRTGASCGGPDGAKGLESAINRIKHFGDEWKDPSKDHDLSGWVRVRLVILYPHTWSFADVDRLLLSFQEKSNLDGKLTIEFFANSCNTASCHKMIAGLSSPLLPAKIKRIVVKGGLSPNKPSRRREREVFPDPEMCKHALAPILKSTSSCLKCLNMTEISFDRASFQHVANALQVTSANVEFRSCKFDKAATAMFIKIYTSTTTPLQSLSLTMSKRCIGADGNEFCEPLPIVVEAILGPKSRLARFVFQHHVSLEGGNGYGSTLANENEFKSIASALSRTPSLQSLCLLGHLHHERPKAVADMLPKFQNLKEFELGGDFRWCENNKALLLGAFEANYSIQKYLLTDDEYETVRRAEMRNRLRLSKIAHAASLMPAVLHSVRFCEHRADIVFDILRFWFSPSNNVSRSSSLAKQEGSNAKNPKIL